MFPGVAAHSADHGRGGFEDIGFLRDQRVTHKASAGDSSDKSPAFVERVFFCRSVASEDRKPMSSVLLIFSGAFRRDIVALLSRLVDVVALAGVDAFDCVETPCPP